MQWFGAGGALMTVRGKGKDLTFSAGGWWLYRSNWKMNSDPTDSEHRGEKKPVCFRIDGICGSVYPVEQH